MTTVERFKTALTPGEKHNKVTVLRYEYLSEKGNVQCLCDCGKYFVGKLSSIRKGDTRSCGCLWRKKNNILEITKPKIKMKGLEDLEGDDIACDSIFRFITKMGMDSIKSYENKLSLCKGSVCVNVFFDGRISCSHDFLQQVSVFELVGLINKLGYGVKQKQL